MTKVAVRRRVTVEDVARRAGVSTATVSRTMNGTARVAQDTVDRVRTAIDELGFRPNPAAQNLRQQRMRTIGLVMPSRGNPFFPELVASVHPEIARRGYSLLLIDAEPPEQQAATMAGSRLVDGILLVGSVHGQVPTGIGSWEGVPVVALDRELSSPNRAIVQCDNVAGSKAVVEHLLELGHRRIAHVRGPLGLAVADQRADGYRTALHGHRISVDDSVVVTDDFGEDSGFAMVSRLLDRPDPPTAVFTANDMMAIGAISAAQNRGLNVPTDVSVAGFDGIHLGRYIHPPVTTYAQPVAAIAQRAVGLLLDAVEDDAGGGRRGTGRPAPTTLRLLGDLVVRGSTCPPSAAPSER